MLSNITGRVGSGDPDPDLTRPDPTREKPCRFFPSESGQHELRHRVLVGISRTKENNKIIRPTKFLQAHEYRERGTTYPKTALYFPNVRESREREREATHFYFGKAVCS